MGYAPTAALNTKLRRNIGRNSLRGSTLLLYRLRCSHKESTSADQVKADIDFLRCTAALTIVACLCFSEIVGYQQGDLRHGLPTMMICHPDSNSSSGPVNGGRPSLIEVISETITRPPVPAPSEKEKNAIRDEMIRIGFIGT